MKNILITLFAIFVIYNASSQRIGIGMTNPIGTFDIARGTGTDGTLVARGTMWPSHFNYQTLENTYIRGGKDGSHVFINDRAELGNVGVGTATPMQKLHVNGITYISDKLGIGNSSPNAPLQLATGNSNRKIVLSDANNNDNQFYGWGVNSGALKYHVADVANHHIFYAGINAGLSNELMRITGNGRVGIGISDPLGTLDIMRGTATNGTLLIRGTTHNSHFNHSTPEHTFIRGGKDGSHVFINDLAQLGNVAIANSNPFGTLDIGRGTGTEGTLVARGTTWPSHFNYAANEDTYIRGGKNGSHVRINDISSLGNVAIGLFDTPMNKVDIKSGGDRSGTHAINRPLYITGDIGANTSGVEIRHNNGTQGIGIGYNTIYATGSDSDQHLQLQAKGSVGSLYFRTNDSERMRIEGNGNVVVAGSVTSASVTTSGNVTAANVNSTGNINVTGDLDVNGKIKTGYSRHESSLIDVPPIGVVTITCDCPNGKVAVGGGFYITHFEVHVGNSYPSSDTQWRIDVDNISAFTTHNAKAYVICTRLAPD